MRIGKRELNYLYLFLFLALSGNPFFKSNGDFSQYIFAAFVSLLVIWNISFFRLNKNIFYFKYVLFFTVIFALQKLVLGLVPYPGLVNFFLKITLGYIVIRLVGKHFEIAYFKVMYFICLVSLGGYLWNVLGFDIPNFLWYDGQLRSIVLFTQNQDGLRNSGMFWEPGAFAGYIILAFLFYLGNFKKLFEAHKFKILILLLALITTFSTTGYLVLFLVVITNVYFEYSKKLGMFILPLLALFSIVAFVIYNDSNFLRQKIENQYVESLDRDEGEFAPDRIGAFLFDMHYIEKHPIIGNGLHEETRYADHPWLMGEKLGHGNGFSNFLATMGVLSFLLFSYYILKYNKNHPWVFMICIIAVLQGEQFLDYPVFLSLPFIFIYHE